MDGPEAVQYKTEAENTPSDLADVDQENGSGVKSTDFARELSVVSPRLNPIPDSPPLSARLPPDPEVEDKGPASSSFDRNCAPSRAPATENSNYDQLSLGQLHELRKKRGYYKEDAKAALRSRLAAMDAASKKLADGSSNEMDISTTVLGKRTRQMEDTMDTSTAVGGYTAKRPRSEALEIALVVDCGTQAAS